MRKHITRRPGYLNPTGMHLVLWVETAPAKSRSRAGHLDVRPVARRAWPVAVIDETVFLTQPIEWAEPAELLRLLTQNRSRRTNLTVWLPRGWESLCLTGLAELMESEHVTYCRLALDGEKVVLRGAADKLPLTVTSLTAWTGGAWDEWRGKVESVLSTTHDDGNGKLTAAAISAAGDSERLLLASVMAILRTCISLSLGRPPASLGALARRWWACWGGRTMRDDSPQPQRRGPKRRPRPMRIVPPIPRRPRVAAQAELHVAHGLVREQYWRGHVDGPVYVVDLSQAYLLALAVGDLPAAYTHTVVNPSPRDLSVWCGRQVACALCRLQDVDFPVLQWRDRRPRRVVGDFWAWLTGCDLQAQLALGTVREVHTAHLWRSIRHTKTSRDCLLGVRSSLESEVGPWALPLWRGLYSALPGAWAQSAYQWRDVQQEFRSGRWATFVMAGAQPGEVDHYRVVGGRVQKREWRGETPTALPLAYACVTSCVREQVDFLRTSLPPGSVLAIACDALWLTGAGLSAMRNAVSCRELEGVTWAVKASYDDAWLDGHGGAVVASQGALSPLTAGVPSAARLGPDGKARWEKAEPWCAAPTGDPQQPRRRIRSSWDGGRLVREHGYPLEENDPWLRVHEHTLNESLLLPFDPASTGRTDDDK